MNGNARTNINKICSLNLFVSQKLKNIFMHQIIMKFIYINYFEINMIKFKLKEITF